jgi:hypothetical protein
VLVLAGCTEGFPPAAAAAHRGWLARQYTAAAEMLAARNVDAATLQVRWRGGGLVKEGRRVALESVLQLRAVCCVLGH